MDRYQRFAKSGVGRFVVGRLGLPDPHPLRRFSPGQPLLDGPVLLGGTGRLVEPVAAVLKSVDVHREAVPDQRYAALVFDATGIDDTARLDGLHAFFHPVIRSLGPSGRVLVLGTPPEEAGSRVAQRALEGFTRSVGKELKRGATVQLVHVAPGAEDGLESTLRFLLSAKSAYVDAQVIRIGPGSVQRPENWLTPLAGKVALVTGASRGIGASPKSLSPG